MELIDYLRLLRRRWLWIVASTMLGILVALVWLGAAPLVYTATAQVFVGTVPSGESSPADAQAASSFTLGRMPSYAALVYSPAAAANVREQLDVELTLDELAERVTADVLDRTVLLEVTASDGDPVMASRLANATAAGLGQTIEELERPAEGVASPVRATVTRPATPPAAPSSPNPRLAVALGMVAGLGFGLLGAALRDQALTSRPPSSGESQGSASTPDRGESVSPDHRAEPDGRPAAQNGSRPVEPVPRPDSVSEQPSTSRDPDQTPTHGVHELPRREQPLESGTAEIPLTGQTTDGWGPEPLFEELRSGPANHPRVGDREPAAVEVDGGRTAVASRPDVEEQDTLPRELDGVGWPSYDVRPR